MQNAMKGLLIAAWVFGLTVGARADDAFCDKQAVTFANQVSPTTNKSVGMAAVSFKLGEKPCYFFSGEIAKGSGIAPDAKTIFELASVTKVFTTTILAEHTMHGLPDSVNLFLPPGYSLTANEEGVTFQQLATFTGGFWWDYPPDFTKGEKFSQDDFVADVNSLDPTDAPPLFGPIPGETNLPTINFYSNGSIGFLGQILMNLDSTKHRPYPFDATGFSDWISDYVTGPLDMPNTKVHPGGSLATGYKIKNGKKEEEPPFPWQPWGAAGALRSDINDMLKFLKANICAYQTLDSECGGISPDIEAALTTAQLPNDYTPKGVLPDPTIYLNALCPSPTEQAWAWRYFTPPNGGHPIISKDGGHPGFSTWIGFSPDKKYGLVILLNTGGLNLINAGENMIRNTP
jgi:CubicO group peptidase (beta-lactamase class C family)